MRCTRCSQSGDRIKTMSSTSTRTSNHAGWSDSFPAPIFEERITKKKEQNREWHLAHVELVVDEGEQRGGGHAHHAVQRLALRRVGLGQLSRGQHDRGERRAHFVAQIQIAATTARQTQTRAQQTTPTYAASFASCTFFFCTSILCFLSYTTKLRARSSSKMAYTENNTIRNVATDGPAETLAEQAGPRPRT